MKVHILFPFTDKPAGGGNQFLRGLKQYFNNLGCYTEDPYSATVVMFNGYPFSRDAFSVFRQLYFIRKKKPSPIIIHRLDSIISVARGNSRDTLIDSSIAQVNKLFANASIFQSAWNRAICERFGIGTELATVIPNASDPMFFFSGVNECRAPQQKIRLITSSWSANWRKGFDILRYLDGNLNFDAYDYTFVGHSPISFKNIRHLPPQTSKELGDLLRDHDIYIAPSVDDVCSNSLIEALSCGLPAVVRRSGGHLELLGQAGVSFTGQNDIRYAITTVASNLSEYRSHIRIPSLNEIGKRYLDYFTQVNEEAALKPHKSMLHSYGISRLVFLILCQKVILPFFKKISSYVPIREKRFYRSLRAFRDFTCKPKNESTFSEQEAKKWISLVLERFPLFIDGLRHPENPSLYRYSWSCDLMKSPCLAASVFAAKIRTMVQVTHEADRLALVKHILSYQMQNGTISDPWIHSNCFVRDCINMFRNCSDQYSVHATRAETRQSFAALHCLGAQPSCRYLGIPDSIQQIKQFVSGLDWARPWGAGSHVSRLVFFLVHDQMWFNGRVAWSTMELLEWIAKDYRQSDGAWYDPNSKISKSEKVNGAMEMLTAYDAAGIEFLANSEGLIDLCLDVATSGETFNQISVIYVLRYCSRLSDHRARDIRAFCLKQLALFTNHYWPWQGGFSFFPDHANDVYCGKRVTTGMAEPDIHGSFMFLWGIVLISEVFGWAKELNLRKPIT